MEDFDYDQIGKEREFQNYKFTCHDPYGFWKISSSKGTTPKELTGQYTSLNECERAVGAYILHKKKEEVVCLDSAAPQSKTTSSKASSQRLPLSPSPKRPAQTPTTASSPEQVK